MPVLRRTNLLLILLSLNLFACAAAGIDPADHEASKEAPNDVLEATPGKSRNEVDLPKKAHVATTATSASKEVEPATASEEERQQDTRTETDDKMALSTSGKEPADKHQETQPKLIVGVIFSTEFILGFAWLRYSYGLEWILAAFLSLPIHTIAEYSPFFVWKMGWVSCEHGLPWLAHEIYFFVLLMCMPTLTMLGYLYEADKSRVKAGKVPVIGVSGIFFEAYTYVATLVGAFNHYSDSMTAVIALQCGWPKAPYLVIVLFVSSFAQAGLNGVMSPVPPLGFMGSCAGINPDSAALAPGSLGGKDYQAAMGVCKFFECLAQAVLQLMFVVETAGSKIVFASIFFSVVMAGKTFAASAAHMYKHFKPAAPYMPVDGQ